MHLTLGNKLVIQLEGMERIWAIRTGPLRFRRSEVLSARADKPISCEQELRMPGTSVPGVIKAGSYLTLHGTDFWYVTRRYFDCALCIFVQHARYHQLVLGISEPHTWAQRINSWREGKGEFAARDSWLLGLTARQARS